MSYIQSNDGNVNAATESDVLVAQPTKDDQPAPESYRVRRMDPPVKTERRHDPRPTGGEMPARLREREQQAEQAYASRAWTAAVDLCTQIIADSSAGSGVKGAALLRRGYSHIQLGHPDRGTADFLEVISLPGAPAELVAKALFNCGVAHSHGGDLVKAVADYTAVIALSGAPAEQVAMALNNRGFAHGLRGNAAQAIADYSAAIVLRGVPAAWVAMALNNRGDAHGRLGDPARAKADYVAVIELPGAPPDLVIRAKTSAKKTKAKR
jgi:tetratricopeptide (TPR) repeat protein